MVHSNVLRFEQSIIDKPHRVCGIFSSDGEQLLEKEENWSWQFQFTDTDKQIMEHALFTYNDARGELPSQLFTKDVIDIAIDRNLSELRVVTRSGTYSLVPNSRHWPSADRIWAVFRNNPEFLDPSVFENEYRAVVEKEGLDYHAAYSWYVQHYRWKNVAQELDMAYTRVPW